jgi:hypothetical protein
LTWQAYARGELPAWNPTIFMGTPLLAAYRPGAFYPPMAVAALLPPFVAFQLLLLLSLAAAAMFTYLYLRRLGAHPVGAYGAGLFFALGPYLTGHLGDSATVVAAPLLPLLLLAAEAYLDGASPARAARLGGTLALLLLAGSPEAARAGAALVFGRIAIAFLLPASRPPSLGGSALALAAGVLLAAPQLVPTLLAAREAGRSVAGLATPEASVLPGLTGLVLRYVSHTPAPSLALAALPLALGGRAIGMAGIALALCLALQWGRGPLAAPGALALVFDLTLSVLAGLSLSAQWRARRQPAGRRLRAYFLAAALASATALSVAAATLGPLPQTLAGAVGVLALSLILYLSLAASPRPFIAGVWLLPLTVSFLLQPHGRRVWDGAPTRRELEQGTPTRQALERMMGPRRSERVLTLARSWPAGEAQDLAFGSLAALRGGRSANGYDPMVPLRNRLALGSMGPGGTLTGAFLRSDPARLELLGIRWVQVPDPELVADAVVGFGERLDVTLEPARPRFFPAPIRAASEVHVVSTLNEAARVPQGETVATLSVRLATGRDLVLPLRAGIHTSEAEYDRPDLGARVSHEKAPVFESHTPLGERFQAHRYLAVLPLPGRYYVRGVEIVRQPGPGRLTLAHLALYDSASRRRAPVSLAAAYLSDSARLREVTFGPRVRLFELPGSAGHARVAERIVALPDAEALQHALEAPTRAGVDPRRHALLLAGESTPRLPRGAQASRAEVARLGASLLEARAAGPGLLVIAEGWDPGWSAELDGRACPLLRVNDVQMGVVLEPGTHRVVLRYTPRGFGAALWLALLGAVLLGAPLLRARAAR